MAITITFDTIAESAAFFGLMNGRNISVEQIGNTMAACITGGNAALAGSTETAAEAPALEAAHIAAAERATAAPTPAPAATAVNPGAKAAVDDALAAAASAKEGTRQRKAREKAEADAAAAAEAAGGPKGESAPKAEPAANTRPTATVEMEPDASGESEEDFFNSTGQDAIAMDAEPAAPTYTYKQVYDALLEWSKAVKRDTFANLMKECGVLSVPDLENKPEKFAHIMKKVAEPITQ